MLVNGWRIKSELVSASLVHSPPREVPALVIIMMCETWDLSTKIYTTTSLPSHSALHLSLKTPLKSGY